MNSWLEPLRSTLDSLAQPVSFFFRNDDVGEESERLTNLLDVFGHYHLPIDLAVIPQALTPELASLLRRRVDAAPEFVGIHQHGYAHVNHESQGRRCEFGSSRSLEQHRSDILAGRFLLQQAFGWRVASIFTPPWNRCNATSGSCLRDAGFQILSRDLTAKPLDIKGLIELPVTIDWLAKRKGSRVTIDGLGVNLSQAATRGIVGVMLHHAVMEKQDLQHLKQLLALLAAHENVSCELMPNVIGTAGRAGAESNAANPNQ